MQSLFHRRPRAIAARWLLPIVAACTLTGTAFAACKPAEPSFWRDEGLSVKVATKLQFNKALMREKVNVKVTGGVAMLWGGMSSALAISTAVSIASQVEGIRCVENRLEVGPPQ